ncbi:putative ribosomally synthesized peptide with SipW-like signal peptide [Brevibacterium sanguinis]|uniref:Ribosomally synthesized peptide with SipW-like signal peptide n=2 Tax=Brevibacterium TaxID=1696 RepID=A0ABX9GU55_9MICO|nr:MULTISPECIES: SipW-dependent-type signal peptide-containing protein [Brevibacterium]RBP68120.1 putative ribosomally synthesized peptide with SipW-like signal peptide [Brevibacterium sanguinis]RBP74463.1 putative ribosomally synthesized peptide with SipW-like signal peptide [Brevibacterium celere]
MHSRETSFRRLRLRRIKAVLAGGLVFGIGSAATMAAWTDTESATGSFTAGRFAIELSVDKSWSNSREMTFNAGGMFPGKVVHAPVFVRTSADTTMKGRISVAGGGVSGTPNALAQSLSYKAVTKSFATAAEAMAAACDDSAFTSGADYVFGSASSSRPLQTGATGSTQQSLQAAAGSVQLYCFRVELASSAPNSAQGQSATHTWTFTAESTAS